MTEPLSDERREEIEEWMLAPGCDGCDVHRELSDPECDQCAVADLLDEIDRLSAIPSVSLADVLERLTELRGRFDAIVDDIAEATDDLTTIAIEIRKGTAS